MLTKDPDLQKWADSILATEPSERAEMVAEDPSVFEVVRKALDAERQTVAKLREALEFYADPWTYMQNREGGMPFERDQDYVTLRNTDPSERMYGAKARAALKEQA